MNTGFSGTGSILRVAAIIAFVTGLQACTGTANLQPPRIASPGIETALPVLPVWQPEYSAHFRHAYAGPSLEPPGLPAPQVPECAIIPVEKPRASWALADVTKGPRRFDTDRGEYRRVYYHLIYIGDD